MKHAALSCRFFILLLCAALLLTGCSQGTDSAQNEAFSSSGQGMLPQSSEATGESDNSLSTMLSGTSEAPETPQEAATDEQGRLLPEKMVYTGHVSVETLEFDQSCEALSGMVERFGGYIESSESSGRTVYREDDGSAQLVDRYAHYVLRIPSERFSEFLESSGELGNVTGSSRQAENIAPRFYDTQSRLDACQVQYDRLLELLERADSMADILAIEAQLTEVRYEIESLTTTLRGWQSQVDYSTVTLSLSEVTRYTPPERQGFLSRMADAVLDSLRSFLDTLANLSIRLIYLLPWLVVLGVLLWLLRRRLPRLPLPHKKRPPLPDAPEGASDGRPGGAEGQAPPDAP